MVTAVLYNCIYVHYLFDILLIVVCVGYTEFLSFK
jgi:hypothetical protein